MLGAGLPGCAQSPLSEFDESIFRPFEPRDADDDVDNTEDPVVVDDDSDDDDEPPVKPREAGVTPSADSGAGDAAAPPSEPDDEDDEPMADAGTPIADASTPAPPVRDAAAAADTGAPAPTRDASTPSAPPDAGTSPPAIACRAGTYRGALTGEILDGSARSRVTGTVTMVLGSTGTSLRVQTGTFEGKDAQGQAFTARVNAVLNCATNRLDNGTLDEGVYNAREGLVSPIRFDGTIAGTLGAPSTTVQGSWRLESRLRSRSGSGTFSATLQQ